MGGHTQMYIRDIGDTEVGPHSKDMIEPKNIISKEEVRNNLGVNET